MERWQTAPKRLLPSNWLELALVLSEDVSRAAIASNGGACVVIDTPVEPLRVMPFRFGFPDVPVLLPVLAQVRWVEPLTSAERAFRAGLRFIV